jgi:hypothetical protein
MNKRRGEQRNWYALPYAERRQLMKGHAAVGRQYAGKIKQLITGSTGLDDAEWGVTLFARDTFQIKAIVYQMRFDPVSAEYADFGEFFIGIQLPLISRWSILGMGDRAVYCARLESVCAERHPGFESPPIRQNAVPERVRL